MAESIVKDFYVYLHRRATDGCVFYVGKGAGRRAWQKTSRNKHWKNIVKKHGLTVEIFQSGLQEWAAFEFECDLIALYGRENLCNMTDGGEGASGCVGRLFTEEQRKKMSFAKKGQIISQEQREKISASLKGKPFTLERKKRLNEPEIKEKHRIAVSLSKKGKPLSEENKKNISKAHKGKKLSPDHCLAIKASLNKIETKEKQRLGIKNALKNPEIQKKRRLATGAKKILCIETGEIFETGYCVQKWLRETNPKAARHNVVSVCRGKYSTAYGYTWRYV